MRSDWLLGISFLACCCRDAVGRDDIVALLLLAAVPELNYSQLEISRKLFERLL